MTRVRKARGLSQEQLGVLVDLTRHAVQAIETGSRYIRLGEAYQLAAALGVTVDQLAGEEPITIQLAAGERTP